MTNHGRRYGNWAQTLNAAQIKAVKEIRRSHEPARKNLGTLGWSVLMQPSIGPARLLEAIHRHHGGGETRWRIELDGSWEEITPQDRGVTSGVSRKRLGPIRGQRTA